MALVACPFCREMFEQSEQSDCPLCGMALTAFEKLPPSHDATEDGVPTAPEVEVLSWAYPGRGRLALPLIALAGLALFFLPWVEMTFPYDSTRSGLSLALGRTGWVFGAGCAWFVLLPTVLSRRSILQLRGARVAASFLSAIPLMTAAVLLVFPPKYLGPVLVRFHYGPAFWATIALSLLAIAVSFRLGGSATEISVRRGTSQGQTLH